MEDVFIHVFGYVFRKSGLFTCYLFFLLIGQKKSLKYLDRTQRDPVLFTQRGINITIGAIEFLILIILVIYMIGG